MALPGGAVYLSPTARRVAVHALQEAARPYANGGDRSYVARELDEAVKALDLGGEIREAE